MKVQYLKKPEIARKSNHLLEKYPSVQSDTIIDVTALATQFLGLHIHFENLQSAYDKYTLGLLIAEHKVILCDRSLEPYGAKKETNEHILRFTIAHEIGHYILHRDYMDQSKPLLFHKNLVAKERGKLETQANMFAACLLMPACEFKACYQEIINSGEYGSYQIKERLAGDFHVSKEAAGFRMKALKLS
jgi:hypothetical protein